MAYQCHGLVLNSADSLEVQLCFKASSKSAVYAGDEYFIFFASALAKQRLKVGRSRQTSARVFDDGLISGFPIVINAVEKSKRGFFCNMIS